MQFLSSLRKKLSEVLTGQHLAPEVYNEMRPMTETRKRRLSESPCMPVRGDESSLKQFLSPCVKTRSQAKFRTPSPPLLLSRSSHNGTNGESGGGVKLTIEERRLLISMRLRHEETQSTEATGGLRTSYPARPKKNVRSMGRRRRVRRELVVNEESENEEEEEEDCEEEDEEEGGGISRSRRRSKKRRSALWVLNCEAEEFLFGETAAEGREVQLPPISHSPPKKKRKVRSTELGDLLKETPFQETKLRNPCFGSSAESSEEFYSSQQPTPKRRKKLKNNSKIPSKKGRKKKRGGGEESSGGESSDQSLGGKYASLLEAINELPSSVSAPIPLLHLPWKFSFESLPESEPWYQTFTSQDSSPCPHFNYFTHYPPPTPLLLPYETKAGCGRRKGGKIKKPPRKSPRCHASTQAILSSFVTKITPRRGRPPKDLAKNTQNSKNGPNAEGNNPLLRALLSTSPKGKILNLGEDLSGDSHLWDSLQFLNDPYVVEFLKKSQTEARLRAARSYFIKENTPNLEPKDEKSNIVSKKAEKLGKISPKSPNMSPKAEKSPNSAPKIEKSPNSEKKGRISPKDNKGERNGKIIPNKSETNGKIKISPKAGEKNGLVSILKNESEKSELFIKNSIGPLKIIIPPPKSSPENGKNGLKLISSPTIRKSPRKVERNEKSCCCGDGYFEKKCSSSSESREKNHRSSNESDKEKNLAQSSGDKNLAQSGGDKNLAQSGGDKNLAQLQSPGEKAKRVTSSVSEGEKKTVILEKSDFFEFFENGEKEEVLFDSGENYSKLPELSWGLLT